MAGAAQVTELLAHARRGDADATEKLVPLLYGELRRMAAGLMARERRAATLQPTALVHEAYLRLLGGGPEEEWQSRAHFLGAAAQAMRRILVEHARRRARLKRGGGRERVTLTDGALRYEARPEEMLALDAALRELQARDAAMARVVELRYFGGLTVEETAEVTGASVRTVHRLWAAARAWLHRALEGGSPAAPGPGDRA
jgi:RNA polymerase sigma factor (TIGR02999 family)